MSDFAILIVRTGNATVARLDPEGGIMLDQLTEELLDLTVTERGHRRAVDAIVAFPMCCSVVLCCSSSCSRVENE
jgi:hypothetical protein